MGLRTGLTMERVLFLKATDARGFQSSLRDGFTHFRDGYPAFKTPGYLRDAPPGLD